jgi:tetratricopeptide (TPR) repeat protein
MSLGNLGFIALRQGNYPAAQERFEESLALRRKIGRPDSVAHALQYLAEAMHAQGEYARARVHLLESVAISRDIGDPRSLANAFRWLARTLTRQGSAARAAKLAGAAATLREGSTDETADYKAFLETLQKALGEQRFQALWAEGRALSREQAIDYALDDSLVEEP